MANVAIFSNTLYNALQRGDGLEAENTLKFIKQYFEDDLTLPEIDAAITDLFSIDVESNLKINLVNFIKNASAKEKFGKAVCETFSLISNLLDSYRVKFDKYVEDIVNVCLQVLRSSCSAAVKEKCILPLSSVVSGNWPNLVSSIVEMLVNQISRRKEKPSVLAKEYVLIGLLCKLYPEYISEHSQTICKCSLMVLEENIQGIVKVSLSLIDGCLVGLTDLMLAFTELFHDDGVCEIIYRVVKTFSDPGDQHRRICARSALRMLAHHSSYFPVSLLTDVTYWHKHLLFWINQDNRDDKAAGCFAMDSFYRTIGAALTSNGPSDSTSDCLRYLLNYFKSVLMPNPQSVDDKETIKPYVVKVALKGFAILISQVRPLLKTDEYLQIADGIARRAMFVYLPTNHLETEGNSEETAEETTEKIEMLCDHIEALTSIGSVSSGSLDSLLRILIVAFPKCSPHRQYNVVKVMKKALPIVDLQTIITYFIQESCRHSVSLSLYYDADITTYWTYNSLNITYETFVPLWRGILELAKEYYISESVYEAFLVAVIKILPRLDVSTTEVMIAQNSSDDQTELSEDLPTNPTEYRLFTNICDLTATLIRCPWTHSFFQRRAFSILRLVYVENKHSVDNGDIGSSGYLRIAEAALEAINSLEIFNDNCLDVQELRDTIEELLMSCTIISSSGLLQLRSSLVLLQTPPQILNQTILENGIEAFQVILRVGKTNLNLITKAMDALEQWDCHLERDILRPLIIKVLPLLNDFLCSLGISDGKIIEVSSETGPVQPGFTKKGSKLLTEGTNSHLKTVQCRIMLFLGKMDSLTVEPLLSKSDPLIAESLNNGDEKRLMDLTERLKLSLPCPQQHKLDIYLDTLVPRIREIALTNTNRDTRLMACQALHSIILMIYGTNVSLPTSHRGSLAPMLFSLTTAMISMCSDADETVLSMFEPLLGQSCHWMAAPANQESPEMAKFIEALMKGASNSSESGVHDTSCAAIREIIRKAVTTAKHDVLPIIISAILRGISQMTVRHDVYERRGGFLIINCAKSELFALDTAVDKYLLELLYNTVKSIEDSDKQNVKDAFVYRHHAFKSLTAILKYLEKKAFIFKKNSSVRRRPPKFGNAMLNDISIWILEKSKNCQNRDVAKMLIKSFVLFSKEIEGCKSAQNFIDKNIKKHGFDVVVKQFFEGHGTFEIKELKRDISCDGLLGYLNNFYTSVDMYILGLENHLIEPSFLLNDQITILVGLNDFFESIGTDGKYIFENLKDYNCYDIITQDIKNRDKVLNAIHNINWKIFHFVILLLNSGFNESTVLENCLNSHFFDSVAYWAMNRNSVKSNNNDISIIIKTLKITLKNEQWSSFEKIFIEHLKNQELISTLLQEFNISILQLSDSKLIINALKYLTEAIILIDSNDVYSIFESWKIPELFDSIFMSLFDSSSLTLRIQDIDASSVNFMGEILNFIFYSKCVETSHLLLILTDNTEVSSRILYNKSTVTRGFHFRNMFQRQVLPHLITSYKIIFEFIDGNISDESKYLYTELLEEMIQYASINNCHKGKFPEAVFLLLTKLWPRLADEWCLPQSSLLRLFSLVSILLPSPLEVIGKSPTAMSSWLLNQLANKDLSFKEKTKLVILLPTVAESGVMQSSNDEKLREALNCLRFGFPLNSREFTEYSSEKSEFLSAYRTLLEATANSGNWIMLDCIIRCTIVDSNHICKDQIAHKLRSFMKRLSSEEQIPILSRIWEAFSDRSTDPVLRVNIMKTFLGRMLREASPSAVEIFFSQFLGEIAVKLDKKIANEKTKDFQLSQLFVDWAVCFELVEIMFSKVSFTDLNSATSTIGNQYFKKTPIPNQLVKELFLKAFNARDVFLPDGTYQPCVYEYLRQSRCAAYKCLYAITVARPKEELKFYMFLINHKQSGSAKLWEGIVDTGKQYSFPIKRDQSLKTKYYQVPVKINANTTTPMVLNSIMAGSSGASCALGLTGDKRKNLFKQTLAEDIFKYDLNGATVRDVVFDNSNLEYMAAQLPLEESDLNSHECMATVCSLVSSMDNLQSRSKDTEGLAVERHAAPDWVKCIAEVMADRNRQKNVRLFLVQMVENMRDVFKKYCKSLLGPVLLVIEDRCTALDMGVNYLDSYLLTMLLSWSDDIVPTTPEEISSASTVLKIIADCIDPNSQIPQIFTYSLELFKTILEKWSSHIKIPHCAILKKLGSTGKLLRAGVHLSAACLVTDNIPWSNSTFEDYKKSMISGLGSDERDTYKPSAEVLGMTLKYISSNIYASMEIDNPQHDAIELFEQLKNKVCILVTQMFKTKNDKFITCVHCIQKYCPDVFGDKIASEVCYILPKFPTKLKNTCLFVFLMCIDTLDGKYLERELLNLELGNLLKDRELRVATLHIINKVIDKLGSDWLLPFLEELCGIAVAKDKESRAIVYEILMRWYDSSPSDKSQKSVQHLQDSTISNISAIYDPSAKPSTSSELNRKRKFESTRIHDIDSSMDVDLKESDILESNLRSTVRIALLDGIDDSDEEIRTRIFEFWSDKYSKELQDRWISASSDILSHTDGISLSRVVRIVLSACRLSPDFSRAKLFDNPLEECNFIEYELNASRSIRNPSLAPIFAETLNTQLTVSTIARQMESGTMPPPRSLRAANSTIVNARSSLSRSYAHSQASATLDSICGLMGQSLQFKRPNEVSMLFNANNQSSRRFETSQGFSLGSESSLLFTMEPQLIHRRTYKPLPKNAAGATDTLSLEKRLRKTFIANKNQSVIKFSGIAVSKRKYKAKERLAEKNPEILKRFRAGEYPDIQIALNDVLNPLLGLATRDLLFSKELFVTIFKSLISHISRFDEPDDNQTLPSSKMSQSVVRVKNPNNDDVIFKKTAANNALKGALRGGNTAEALLEVIRLCGGSLEDNTVNIEEVARACGCDWLGKLITEEQEMAACDVSGDCKTPPTKSRKLTNSSKEKLQLLDKRSGEIRRLRSRGCWNQLQEIYADAAIDENLTEHERKHFSKEYFECMARMSDWEDMICQLGQQLTPDVLDDLDTTSEISSSEQSLMATFNWDLVWKNDWTRDCFLGRIFDAWVCRVASGESIEGLPLLFEGKKGEMKAAQSIFEMSLTKWLDDDSKKVYLLTFMSSRLALWKSVTGPGDAAIGSADTAIGYMKTIWAKENSGNRSQNVFNDLQMVAETRRFLDCPIFKSSTVNMTSEETKNSLWMTNAAWRNCVPAPNDDTMYWDVRIAARSAFTSILQKAIKIEVMGEVEEETAELQSIITALTETQKASELGLIRAAVQQGNESLAIKYIMRNIKFMKANEGLPWYLEWVNTQLIKAINEVHPTHKFQLILKAWQSARKFHDDFSESDDPHSYAGILMKISYLADEISSILKKSSHLCEAKDINSLMQLIGYSDQSMDVEQIQKETIAHGAEYLKEAIRIVENSQDGAGSTKELNQIPVYKRSYSIYANAGRTRKEFVSDAYLTMAKFCRKMKSEYGDLSSSLNLIPLTVRSVLRAVQYGNREATKLFPVLLLEMEQLPKGDATFHLFTTEVESIPPHLLLPWSPQLLAHLPSLEDALLPLLIRLSTLYPHCIVPHYRLSRKTWQSVPKMAHILERLDSLLMQNQHTDNILQAIGYVCDPAILLKTHIVNLAEALKCNDAAKWDVAMKDLFTEVYPAVNRVDGINLQGPNFKVLSEYKATLLSIEKYSADRKQTATRLSWLENSQNLRKSGVKSLADFSPYLASYGQSSGHAAVMFGQDGGWIDNCTSPNSLLDKPVTIVGFDREVTEMSSLCRPIRIGVWGSDGVKRHFLVKRSEDLRQDDRIQRLFALINDTLQKHDMAIATYKVIPLSFDFGLIQWVTGCATLKELAADNKAIMDEAYLQREKFTTIFGDTREVRYGNMAEEYLQSENAYEKALQRIPKYILRNAFLKLSVTPERFVKMRNNYVRSLAPMNIAHWILGIGDRHLSNCLVSLQTGSVVGVDFGYAFGTATQILEIPEMTPFRLTPQILGVLAPHGSKGTLRHLMTDCLEQFCSDASALLAAMEVFVREPAMDWLRHATNKLQMQQHDEHKLDNMNDTIKNACYWSANIKIEQCKRKLSGTSPSLTIEEDLKSRSLSPNHNHHYIQILRRATLRQDEKINNICLTVDQQVDELINLSTNKGILSVTFSGWVPWF